MILTNSGGPGVMAADALATSGLQPAHLSEKALAALNEVLPPHWSQGNPIDILGDADPQRYAQSVSCLEQEDLDGLLIILNPQAMTSPAQVAGALTDIVGRKPYPVFTSWMGGKDVEEGIQVLNRAGIPTYETPEQAIQAFAYLYGYAENIQLLQEVPPRFDRAVAYDRDSAGPLIDRGLERDNGVLTEVESKQLLAAYGVPVNDTRLAATPDRAAALASEWDAPVALKICSPGIVHKSDADGVQLDLKTGSEVKRAFRRIVESGRRHAPDAYIQGVSVQPMVSSGQVELLIGAKKDPNFGPVLLFGMGGILAEVFEDHNLGLVPLNRLLARRLIDQSRASIILKGYRNIPPADMQALEALLVSLSQLMIDVPQITELDMNPVVIRNKKPLVLDARVVMESTDHKPPHHLVISPYPEQYEDRHVQTDGLDLFIRPIKPEDAPLIEDLFDRLSPSSIYHRFFRPLKSLPHDMLVRFTQIDYDREIALVAIDESRPQERMLGVARIIGEIDGRNGEFAVVVADKWQSQGVGAELLARCLAIARERQMRRVWGLALAENKQMLALARKLGFEIKRSADPGEYEMIIELDRLDLQSIPGRGG
jgi:acetyltransferase